MHRNWKWEVFHLLLTLISTLLGQWKCSTVAGLAIAITISFYGLSEMVLIIFFKYIFTVNGVWNAIWKLFTEYLAKGNYNYIDVWWQCVPGTEADTYTGIREAGKNTA